MLTCHSEMLHTSDSAVRRKHQYPRVFDYVQSPRSQWKAEDNCLLLHLTTAYKEPKQTQAACSCQVSPLLHMMLFSQK